MKMSVCTRILQAITPWHNAFEKVKYRYSKIWLLDIDYWTLFWTRSDRDALKAFLLIICGIKTASSPIFRIRFISREVLRKGLPCFLSHGIFCSDSSPCNYWPDGGLPGHLFMYNKNMQEREIPLDISFAWENMQERGKYERKYKRT